MEIVMRRILASAVAFLVTACCCPCPESEPPPEECSPVLHEGEVCLHDCECCSDFCDFDPKLNHIGKCVGLCP
jgi:hypothetical protein